MEFALDDAFNKSAEVAAAARYPQIRLFTVGSGGFYSHVPLTSLRTIEQPWSVASPQTVARGGMFGVFSATCWFFGRQLADANPGLPIGLISSNRGGSPIAEWVPASKSCGGQQQGHLFNTQIAPFATGPMSLAGFTWYQARDTHTHRCCPIEPQPVDPHSSSRDTQTPPRRPTLLIPRHPNPTA